jgi:hypothetical protein
MVYCPSFDPVLAVWRAKKHCRSLAAAIYYYFELALIDLRY